MTAEINTDGSQHWLFFMYEDKPPGNIALITCSSEKQATLWCILSNITLRASYEYQQIVIQPYAWGTCKAWLILLLYNGSIHKNLILNKILDTMLPVTSSIFTVPMNRIPKQNQSWMNQQCFILKWLVCLNESVE